MVNDGPKFHSTGLFPDATFRTLPQLCAPEEAAKITSERETP